MPQSKPYNQHNKKQRKQKCKGNINERHFNLKKKKKKHRIHQKANRKPKVITVKEKGETILLVPKVYLMSAIGPLSFK